MKTLAIFVSTLALTFTFACSGKSSIVKDAEKFKERMCACKDMKCGDEVEKTRIAWFKSKGKEATDSDKEAMKPIVRDYRKCISDLLDKEKTKKPPKGTKPASKK